MSWLVTRLNQLTTLTGLAIRWLTLLMVVLVCAIVFMRYFLSMPSTFLQESVLYLHATVFMAGMAYTWQQGGHVRVDVFSRSFRPSYRKWVERLGIMLFLIPICLFILYMSWDYVLKSWAILERSDETGGLPFVYLLKTLLLIMPTLLLLQAVVELAKTFLPTEIDAIQGEARG